ncbi:MAG: hypothetical protein L3J74_18615 [Bacteroidales bacterium]|nr:hypothetical protein [Bacteroidales bacterium]
MEDYIKINIIELTDSLNEDDYEIFKKLFNTMKGIQNFSIAGKTLRIEYNSYLISLKDIKELLFLNSYEIRKTKKSNFLQKFILNLAKSNKETLGSGGLECCKLNAKI